MSDNDQDQGVGERPAKQNVTAPDELEGDYLFKTDLDILNKEILENTNNIYKIIQIDFTFVPIFLAGVLALGKGDGGGSWWVASLASLLVFAIIIPSILLVVSSLNSTTRISQYLLLRYDSSDKLKGWQYYIQAFRDKDTKKKYRSFRWSLTWIFAGLSSLTILVSLASFLMYISQPEVVGGASKLFWVQILIYIVAIGICVVMSVFSILYLRRSWSGTTLKECKDFWCSIDEDIKNLIKC